MRAVLEALARDHDAIRRRFGAELSRRDTSGANLPSAAEFDAALAGMRAALQQALGGDFEPLLGQASAIRLLIGGREVTRSIVLESIIALRRAVYPFVIGEPPPSANTLAERLAGFDRLVAWFIVEISGGSGSQFEEARDAMFLRSVVENIPYMIFVKDARDLRFVRFNKAGEELVGYSRDELLGKSDYDFFPAAEADFFTRHDRQVLDGRRPVDIPEEPIETRTQGRRLLHTRKIPICDEAGAPLYLLGISEDVTERRRTELELERAKEAAESASRAKSEFLARMSHEIRTPLNGIIGMTELALEADSTTDRRECLEIVRGSAESLLRVLNDVLDFSKIDAGKLELEAIPFDLDASLRLTIKAFEHRARDRGLDFSYAPEADVPRALVGDPLRLRQVLINLLDNAVRFTERGRVDARVEVAERGDADVTLHFVVEDSGIGVPHDKREIIFASFTQADESITRRFGGTGLGLPIASRLVALMGGRIWLESEPGRGSAFHFTARFGIAAGVPAESRDLLSAGTHVPPLTVLVAEDHPVNRAVIVRILARHGHRVIEAQDGTEVLALLGRGQVDLVLMDVEMPQLGGLEATRRVRERERPDERRTPIIALTAPA
jgi:PAS domain S-box-containing protein